MKNLFIKLEECINEKKNAVIVSIIESSGSAPRRAGAKMLVTDAGRISGTVGGGAIEYEAMRLAQGFLNDRACGTHSFALTPNRREDLGMVCGGDVTLYFQFVDAADANAATIVRHAPDMIKSGEKSWLITEISTGTMAFYSKISGLTGAFELPVEIFDAVADNPTIHAANGRDYFIEPFVQAGFVYIFGGGHVAQELVPVASRAGFRCVVLDDRPEFTSIELFPGAFDSVPVDFNDIEKAATITGNDYIVIMTRGHRYDSAVQAQAMRTNARYIGVMGSKSKIVHVSAQMRELGFTDKDLARIHTPIGLDIKAETPAEIAVSIAAELIIERNSQR